jgi:hypothetical protein
MADVQLSQYTHPIPPQTASATTIGISMMRIMMGCTRDFAAPIKALRTTFMEFLMVSTNSINLLFQ